MNKPRKSPKIKPMKSSTRSMSKKDKLKAILENKPLPKDPKCSQSSAKTSGKKKSSKVKPCKKLSTEQPNTTLTKSGNSEKKSIKVRSQSSNMGGRPTKYKPEYCQMLIESMAQGISMEAFAGTISVSRETIYDWTRRIPEFKEAKEIGEMKAIKFLEEMGRSLAVGTLKGNVTAWIFISKNRIHWKDKVDLTSSDNTVAPQVNIYLPDNKRDKKK